MTIWIVLLLLLAMLSPLVWLVPSKGQRGRMELRLQARRMGLSMQLSRQEWPYWLVQEPPHSCAEYHRPRLRKRDVWCYWQNEPGSWLNQWREPCEDTAVLPHLAGLPKDVYKVEASSQMIALYWGERGTAEDLQRIADTLKALA